MEDWQSVVRRYFDETQASWAQRSGPHSAQLGEFNPTSLPTNPSCDFRNTSRWNVVTTISTRLFAACCHALTTILVRNSMDFVRMIKNGSIQLWSFEQSAHLNGEFLRAMTL